MQISNEQFDDEAGAAYLAHNRKAAARTTGFLLSFAISFTISSKVLQAEYLMNWSFLLYGLAVLVGIHFLLLHFRVTRGYFGSNSQEARALIGFVLKDAADADLRKP